MLFPTIERADTTGFLQEASTVAYQENPFYNSGMCQISYGYKLEKDKWRRKFLFLQRLANF